VSDLSGKAAISGQTFTGDIAAPGITATGSFTSPGIDDDATSTAITIDSSENVGIGTTNPKYKLDISTDASDSSPLQKIRLDLSNDTGTSSSGLVWAPNYSDYTKQSAAIKAMSEGNFFRAGIGFFTGNTSDKSTDAVERMRIAANGNVGIGTETPAEKLDVDGSIRASTGILFGTDTAAANTLDDYEEGTWTPEDYEGNVSLSINNAAYIKIGSLVHFELDIIVATNSETDDLRITLPFSTVGKGSSVVGFSQASVGDTKAGTQSNTIYLWEGDGGANQSFDQYSGDILRISGNYITS
jgi:hypothetical protein